MLRFAVIGCLVLWSSLAEAVKWDFDDGTTQGWSPKERLNGVGQMNFICFQGRSKTACGGSMSRPR